MANESRVTSQVVDAVVTGGDARVTSQVVEVVFPFDTSNNLIAFLSGSAIIGADLNTINKILSANLIGSANVTALFDKNLTPATSTLSLTQNASAFNEPVGNTLFEITQTAIVETTLTNVTNNTLTLTQIAEQESDFLRSTVDVINLDQSAQSTHTLPTKTATSTLSLSDAAVAARLTLNTLALTHTAVGVIGGLLESTTNTLSLSDVAVGTTVLLASPSNTLLISQTVDPDLITTKTVANTLNLTDLAFATTIGTKCLVIFQAPFHFLQTSIVLSCALFGDTENIVSEVALRRSMNGATQTHVKTNSNRRINYTFRLLDRQKAVEVTEFFKFYNSDEIKMTNWKGEIWKVNLLTNPIDFVKTGRTTTDVSLEFEGEILNG